MLFKMKTSKIRLLTGFALVAGMAFMSAPFLPSVANAQYAGNTDARYRMEMETRLQQLETELRSLRGTIEEQNFKLSRTDSKVDRVLGDVELRLSDLEKAERTSASLARKSSLSDISTSAGDARADVPSRSSVSSLNTARRAGALGSGNDSAAAQYESAFGLLKAGQYEEAGGQFLAFIKTYPDNDLAGNAKYWLGETFYVRGDYQRAARVFAEGYKEYPKSGKRADYLLKLGLSLSSMGSTDDACVALGQLNSEYGDTSTPVVQRGVAERNRIGCS